MEDNNNKARFISHKDTAIVTIEQLREIATPGSTRYWRPVSHVELVESIKLDLSYQGLEVTREQFAVGSNGNKLFGAFDLAEQLVPGVSSAIGFRHSNDKKIAIQIVAGARVFVCDNMALSGDITVLKQKHTWGYSLRDLIRRGMDSWRNKQSNFANSIERMQNTSLSTHEAQALLAKSLYDGILTFQTFKIAYDIFFERAQRNPEQYPDCAQMTAWGLHNAVTRALKESTPNVAFNSTVGFSKVFGA